VVLKATANENAYLLIKEEDQSCVAFAVAWLEPVI